MKPGAIVRTTRVIERDRTIPTGTRLTITKSIQLSASRWLLSGVDDAGHRVFNFSESAVEIVR